MSSREILHGVAKYYSDKLLRHGATPQGVDWRDQASQELRFAQFDRLIADDLGGRIADFGCGYGEYLAYLRARNFTGHYFGIDVSAPMVEAAKDRFSNDRRATFLVGDTAAELCDYAVASGIFNVRLNVSIVNWENYIAATLAKMAAVARKGFAFNCITNKVDYRRGDLYYGDPDEWSEKFAAMFDVDATLVENYGLYDFTIVARHKTSQQEQ